MATGIGRNTAAVEGPAASDDAAQAVPRGRTRRWILTAVVGAFLLYLVVAAARNPRFEWDIVGRYMFSDLVLEGLVTSLSLTAMLLVFGVLLGTLIGLARASDFAPLRGFAWTFTWFFRAVPPLVQLLLWYNLAYLIPEITLSIPFGPEILSVNANDLISPFTAAVLGLGLLESAYMAEIIRAGLGSVDRGQTDAALSVGLSRRKTFFRIVLPQSMRFIIPPMGSQAILLLKATSLVSIIGLSDLLHTVQAIYNRTLEVVPLLMVATIWYLILVSILSVGQIALERRYSRSFAERKAAVREDLV
ncbi:ABC transporter permease subunit [Rhodobacterales bacterium HKCCE2091]|nr:ABC transporter permease subunit [Rhodobacterales bacterium HKCCE2091]